MTEQMWCWRRWWSLALLLGGLALFSQCRCSDVPAESKGCLELRDQLEDRTDPQAKAFQQVFTSINPEAFGCLQLAYGDSPDALNVARAITVFYRNPDIFGACDDGSYNCQVKLSLPRSADGKYLRMRLFLTSLEPEDAEQARQLCKEASQDPEFACTPDKDCLLTMEFQQKVDGYQPVPVPEDGPHNETCALSYQGSAGPSEPPPVDVDGPVGPELLPDASEPPSEPIGPDDVPEPPSELRPDDVLPEPLCRAGATKPCYTGASGTAGKGRCKGGMQSCAGGAWGPCMGEVLPAREVCDGFDNDCDGVIDNGCPWLMAGGGADEDQGLGIATDGQGKLLIAGTLHAPSDGLQIKFGPITHMLKTGWTSFVGKVDPRRGTPEFLVPIRSDAPMADNGSSAVAAAGSLILSVGYFRQPVILPYGTSMRMSPMADLSQGLSADGYIAVNDDKGGSVAGQRIGGAGDDVIGDIVCCRISGGLKVAYALALIRVPGVGKKSFTYGRSSTTPAVPFAAPDSNDAFNDRLNTALVLVELWIDESKTPPLTQLELVQVALWEADDLSLVATYQQEFPRMALFRYPDPSQVSLLLAFSSNVAKKAGSPEKLYLVQSQRRDLSGTGLRATLARIDVSDDVPKVRSKIERTWYTRLLSNYPVNVRGIAVRDAGGGLLDVAVTGSFGTELKLGGATLTSMGASDVFVAKYSMSQAKPAIASTNPSAAISGGGAGLDQGNAVAFDLKGDIFITGYANAMGGKPSFGANIEGFTSAGRNFLYAKVRADGASWLWALGDGYALAKGAAGHGLVGTLDGSMYLIGSYPNNMFLKQKVDPFWGSVGASSFLVAKDLNKLVSQFP